MEMQPIDPNLIIGRLEAGTLVRKDWGDGRERACLLAALAPQCAASRSAGACPAEVMPAWLARMTPLMDDEGSEDAWEPFVRRYAAVAARWHRLDEAGWRRALLGSLIAILEVAQPNESFIGAESHDARSRGDRIFTEVILEDPSGSCDRVIALCREEAPTEDPRWYAAAGRALAPMWGAAAAAAAAVRAAEAKEAKEAKEAVAKAAEAAAWTRARAKATMWAAAWDRMTAGILAAIEVECDRVKF